jgi:hypothetical protein
MLEQVSLACPGRLRCTRVDPDILLKSGRPDTRNFSPAGSDSSKGRGLSTGALTGGVLPSARAGGSASVPALSPVGLSGVGLVGEELEFLQAIVEAS